MTDLLYLASQSPRRRQLLDQIGVRHELLLPGADEDAEGLEAVQPGEPPEAYCARVTAAKLDAALARRVARGLPQAPILCADTTVAVDDLILGKPADEADAARMLALMSGRTHRVITAVAVGDTAQQASAMSVSQVEFAALSAAQIERYIASREPFGKAGAYAIQSQAAAWIVHIAGSYSGIMGLPLFETARLLEKFGFEF
ncbi:MAG: septum formation inhibitor Maf [Proteobacteria bacterium]|jgi:septum formation protein|nr:septum formation inhibitor Maf [Methylibium sp.]MBY0368347.1 Maf family nucleotide pyrophosphatase [Burkholderiaceae bacterium]MCH8856502.1 septum formation inhibitor Maf [Pseudomonadota bacterium]|mmetsp:Transcript_5870/g.23127  ORF Transcript_5870/g.23127 Transcript_5870/m.23127 type:complete len:201 (-) Transcript_5870:1723-2325(-)